MLDWLLSSSMRPLASDAASSSLASTPRYAASAMAVTGDSTDSDSHPEPTSICWEYTLSSAPSISDVRAL